MVPTRKLWIIFPIKQKFNTTAAFLYTFFKLFNLVKTGNDSVFSVKIGRKHCQKNYHDKF